MTDALPGDRPRRESLSVVDAAVRAGELFDAHGRALLGYLARRVGPDAAQDLLSDTFVVMVGEDRVLDVDRGGERAWLFGIATNLVRRRARDQTRAAAGLSRLAGLRPATDDGPASVVAERVDAHRRVAQLAVALDALAPDDREVLLLVAWGGLSPTEAAAALGIPPGTARSRLNRVRTRLRTLAPTLSDDDRTTP